MRRISMILALSSIFVLPLAVGCGDDADEDAPPASGGTAGKGGSSGKGGTSGKGGKGGSGNSDGGAPESTGGAPESTGGAPDNNVGGGGADGAGVRIPDLGEDCGELTAGGDLPDEGTVEGGKYYEIPGRVDVTGVLEIEPCTAIIGQGEDDVIVVQPGGQLNAVGTATNPIVFSSASQNPAPGDWGGLVLAGNAVCNDATADTKCEVEGFASEPPLYGNVAADAVDDESSGSLEYVRIEYSGVDLGGGKEINGLTLASIGSGTTISHVMVAHTLDDCFEFFGGTVNADHLVCYDPGDDMFDTDSGYSGHVQFAFGRQLEPVTSDPNGFEMDNDGTDFAKTPISAPNFSNVTLCGTNVAASGNPKNGGVLRRGTAGALMNVLITGFETAAFSVRNTPDTTITVTSTTQWDNGALLDANAEQTVTDTWFTDEATNSSTEPADFGDCYADPPAPFPAAPIAGEAPTGFADDAADYQGAFEDANDDWMTGAWVSWD